MSDKNRAKGSKAKTNIVVSEENRQNYIQVAAYYLSEKDNPDHCCDLDNWLTAETEIDQLIMEGKL